MNQPQIFGITVNFWLFFGLAGQILFGARFLIQWVCSELKKESHIPIAFWYLSISGGLMLLIYAISIKDPVFILGQSTGVIVYARNLRLIYKRRKQQNPLNDVVERKK